MHEPVPRGPSIAFLVFGWIVFLVLVVVTLAFLPGDGWRGVRAVLAVLFLWAVITGLLVRRLFPRSRIAVLFPKTTAGGTPFDAPVRNGLLTILLYLAVAIVLVAASLHFGWH